MNSFEQLVEANILVENDFEEHENGSARRYNVTNEYTVRILSQHDNETWSTTGIIELITDADKEQYWVAQREDDTDSPNTYRVGVPIDLKVFKIIE